MRPTSPKPPTTKETHEHRNQNHRRNDPRHQSHAARLTPADLEAVIVDTQFLRPSGTLTICVLTLRNGCKVTGESACVSPENFNEAIGQKVARENAVRKIWELEGYLLLERLYQESIATKEA